MSLINRIILPAVFLLLAACASEIAPPPDVPESLPQSPVRPSLAPLVAADPEQALKAAMDLYKAGKGEPALFLAHSVAEQHPKTVWGRRALFVLERALIQLDRAEEADAAMLRVREEYPELADYALFALAEYHFSRDRFSRAAALYQPVAEEAGGGPLAPAATYRRALALLNSDAYLQAIDAFEQCLKAHPEAESAPDAGLGLARALTAEARLDQAARAYRDVWTKYPGTPADQEAESGLILLKAGGADVPEPSAYELLERGKNLFRAARYDRAAAVFTEILGGKPESSSRPEAMFRAGVALFYHGKRADAASLLENMLREYPSDPRAPEALLWTGKAYSRLGDWERGTKAFRMLLDRFPASEWADDALFLTGNIHRETGDVKQAVQVYGQLAREYPDSKFADSALWWRAWMQYTGEDFQKAEQALRELVNRYPRSFLVNQARYWQGKASEQQGEFARAAAYYNRVLEKSPYTYYGYRSAERLRHLDTAPAASPAVFFDDLAPACAEGPCPDDPPVPQDSDDGPPVWTEEAKQVLSSEPLFKKTLELMHLDMKKEAALELRRLQNKAPGNRGMLFGLSKSFFELGDYHRSLTLVLGKYERYLEGPASGAFPDLWLLAYPRGYWETILSYARKYGQDPYFIAAIIREESRFSPEALSPAGARGLMQVMPGTGAWAARLINLPEFDHGRLFDTETGINIGTWYISRLMTRFKGDPLLAAAAYNAGPEAVAGWIVKNGYGEERDLFVERIPFFETRGYVKKVLRNYAEYRRIYGKDGESVDSGLRMEP
jgi:soluble lytic murein transglycosylase